MKQIAFSILFLIGLVGSNVLMGQQTEQDESTRPTCLSDDVSRFLREQYPQGLDPEEAPATKTLHEGEPEFLFVVPVVFHIMTDGGAELGVTLEQCQSQIDALNEDFGRYGNGFNSHPDGLNTKIKFCLASRDPNGNFTIGMDTAEYGFTSNHNPFTPGLDSSMKSLAVWDIERYMNVYIVRSILNGANSGYAYFPDEVVDNVLDGVVLDYRHVGRTGTAVGLGRTGTHEVGHYLSLYHPWGLEDTLCGSPNGDYCDDTPEVPVQYFSLAPSCFHPPTCEGGDVMRQIENYMDYSDDECQNMFTFCQSQRMRQAISRYRGELVSSENLALTGCTETLVSEPTTDSVIVYPNPVSDVLLIYADFENENPVSIELYDMAGRLVRKIDPAGQGRGAIPLDVTDISIGGPYHLLVRLDNRYHRETIIISR